ENLCTRYDFFFSSRRRHTRLQGDWSSDVCSSDLEKKPGRCGRDSSNRLHFAVARGHLQLRQSASARGPRERPSLDTNRAFRPARSEERRVGKESTAQWPTDP